MSEYIALIRFFYFRGCPEKLDEVMDVKLYHTLNGGVLYDRIKILKLPKDKDVCDLRGQIEDYYYEIK